MTKRQRNNRKRLAQLTTFILIFELVLIYSIIFLLKYQLITFNLIITFIVNSIISILLYELCNYLKIEL